MPALGHGNSRPAFSVFPDVHPDAGKECWLCARSARVRLRRATMLLPIHCRLAAAALALVLAGAQAVPQEARRQQPAAPQQQAPAGLPLYSSDGKLLGRVIAAGVDNDNEPVLVAEIQRPLGIGPQAIAIPTDLFVQKRDRIELTITEAEVNARLGGTSR
jgi:hypothetical protein